jgi:hypothetical protein
MIRIYPSRLPGEPLETHHIESSLTLAAWLDGNVKGFVLDRSHPITVDVDGVTLPPERWEETQITAGSDVRIYPIPQNSSWIDFIIPGYSLQWKAFEYVKSLFDTPKPGSFQSGRQIGDSASNGNQARPGGVVRELLGQSRIYPDLISAQVSRFVNKRRMETQMLLCIGTGSYSVLGGSVRVGNTPFVSLGADASFEIYDPGESLAGDQAAENWYLCPEIGATGGGTPGLDLGSEETAGEAPITDALFLSGKTLSLVGGGAEFPASWTPGNTVVIRAPDNYQIAQVGPRSRISGPLSDLAPSVDMKVSLHYAGAEYSLVVYAYAAEVPGVPGVGGSPSTVLASAAPTTYDFSVNPAVWTITYQGVTRTLSCSANYANMSALVADLTSQLSGMGLTAQDSSGRLLIGEPISPYLGGVISQSSAPIELFGVSPTYTVGTASSGGTPPQAAYVELDYDNAVPPSEGDPGSPATPFSGLPLGDVRLSLSHRGAQYRLTSVSGTSAGVDRLLLGVVDAGWSGWASRTVLDYYAATAPTGENWVGPFYAAPEGALVTEIEYDIMFPSGLGYANSDGDLEAIRRWSELQWRDSSVGGAWTTVSNQYRDATADQIGFTHDLLLPYPMRPQVRVRRVGATGNSRDYERMNWYGLRARLPHATSYPGYTTMTATIRTGSRLSAQSDRKISVVANRLYPGGLSRSIRDAVYCVTDSLGISRAELDTQQIDALQDAFWGPRGETFDLDFTDQQTVRDVLRTIFAAGMGHLKLSGGLISAVREGVQSVPAGALSPHEMSGPLQVSFQAPAHDDFDGVDVEYLGAATWTVETVQCRMPGSAGRKVEKISADGVTSRTRAWRIGMRRLRKLLGQRLSFSCDTEMDALNFEYLDRVTLTDDLPGTTISSLIIGAEWQGDRVVLTTSEPLDWSVAAPRCLIRRHDGTVTGVLTPTQVSEFGLSLPAEAIDFDLLIDDPVIEPARLLFGPSTRLGYDALIEEVAPDESGRCSVSALQYDPRYYADDDNVPA